MNDTDYNGITRNDIMRLVNSQFSIVWHRGNYIIRSTRQNITVAIGFYAWVDALVFLEEDAKVILHGLPRKTLIRFSKAKAWNEQSGLRVINEDTGWGKRSLLNKSGSGKSQVVEFVSTLAVPYG